MSEGIAIYAEDGEDFQEYAYKDTGKRVLPEIQIGDEIKRNGIWELILLPNICFETDIK
jgi:hypothetical protein